MKIAYLAASLCKLPHWNLNYKKKKGGSKAQPLASFFCDQADVFCLGLHWFSIVSIAQFA